MPGKVNFKRAKIQQGRTEIFFHFILLLPFILDGGDQRAAVNDGDIKFFHRAILVLRNSCYEQTIITVAKVQGWG